ncbi:hypothetical protein R0381_003613 [Jeongeupia wiesaeckerbachi]|uniref:hypothetical protein n=1 Tax=Jeongeupia wiesaeckerbachi TaxID=3051218 RepID=UPI003D8067BB
MAKLTNLFEWGMTTVVDLFKEAEEAEGNQLEMVEMELKNGRTVAIALISGPYAHDMTQMMRDAKSRAG